MFTSLINNCIYAFWQSRRHNYVSTFRRLADLQEQLTDLQQEFDVSKEECLGHQKVIQELKLKLEEVI